METALAEIVKEQNLDTTKSETVLKSFTAFFEKAKDLEKKAKAIVVTDVSQIEGKPLRGRNIFENFVPSFLYVGKNGKNTLYQIVEALQGQTISPEQEAVGITGAVLNSFIGHQCRVVTKQQKKGDKTYMNIDSFLIVKNALSPLTSAEKEEAKVKPKDAEAEKKADGQYAGVDTTLPPVLD